MGKKAFFNILILCLSIFFVLLPNRAKAVTAADWRAGRIIDDTLFTDKSSMTVQDIQNFLNSKVLNCDTDGLKTSEYGGGTRAQYAAARVAAGSPTANLVPLTCLKDYYEVPKLTPSPALPASNYGGAAIPVGAKSAAQIIWDAAQQNNISPKTLLVIIQRESVGPLITDDWPFRSQYNYALGAHCPDTPSGCDPNYAGFSIQVNEGAALFRWYIDNMSQPWWSYKKLGMNSILWNVESTGCGAGDVNIETKATAALYTYTPYQPNQAALNNLYGSGDGCSAYGNRNFWTYYNDWFGDPSRANGDIAITTPIALSDPTPKVGETVTISYTVQNKGTVNIDSGGLWMCVTYNNKYFGLGGGHKVLTPNETLIISGNLLLSAAGALRVVACGDIPGGPGWTYGYPYASNAGDRDKTFTVGKSPILITTPIALSDPTPKVGETVTISYTVQNKGTVNIDSGGLWMCVTYNNKYFGLGGGHKVLTPNETLIISGNLLLSAAGALRVVACGDIPGGPGWTYGYPYASNAGDRDKTFTVGKSPILITTPIALSDPTPKVGETVTISYTVQNKGTVNIDSGGLWMCVTYNNKYFGLGGGHKVLTPNETLIISGNLLLSAAGALRVVACGDIPGGPGWTYGYPYASNAGDRDKTFTVGKSPILITTPIALSDPTPKVGETVTISYTVQNKGTVNIDSGGLWMCVTYNNKYFGLGGGHKVLTPNETLIISGNLLLSAAGALRVVACGDIPGGPGWTYGYPYASNAGDRDKTFLVGS